MTTLKLTICVRVGFHKHSMVWIVSIWRTKEKINLIFTERGRFEIENDKQEYINNNNNTTKNESSVDFDDDEKNKKYIYIYI